MSQRHFRDFAREIRPLGGPVAKARAEPVYCQIAPAHAAQRHRHGHVADRLLVATAGKDEIARANRRHLLDDRDRLRR